MAKIYMNDFRVTTSVVPVLRYLDGNKTDELVIFTDDKMTDFDTHIALIDNKVVKLFANESGFAAIIDKDIFNEKDVCPIRLVFSNSVTEKTKGTNTFYICNDRTGYIYGDYIEVPDDIITYREACRAYAEECGRIVDAVKFDVGAKVTQDEEGATIYITDPFGTTKAKVYNGATGPQGNTGADGHSPIVKASKDGTVTTITVDNEVIATINDGAKGETGKAGHSPSVTATKDGTVTTVKVDGTTIATINDGERGNTGVAGKDGHSPIVTATKSGTVTTVSVDGKAIATINDGAKGETGVAGADGHSPSVTATKSGTVTTVKVDGKTVATINDGARGETGLQGIPGPAYTLTDTDKALITNEVLAQFTNAESTGM